MAFDAKAVTEELIAWIKEWFTQNGEHKNALVNLANSRNGAVTLALCVRALRAEQVIAVMLTYGKTIDLNPLYRLCSGLAVRRYEFDSDIVRAAVWCQLNAKARPIHDAAKAALIPRLRMVMLYGLAESRDCWVADTCDLSKAYIGRFTGHGEPEGDFAPLAGLTSQEILEIGRYLNLPSEVIETVPVDEQTGKSEEKTFKFSYATLDRYIREGVCDDPIVQKRIEKLHEKSVVKAKSTPSFDLPQEDAKTRK